VGVEVVVVFVVEVVVCVVAVPELAALETVVLVDAAVTRAVAEGTAGGMPPHAVVSIVNVNNRARIAIPRSSASRTNTPFSHTRVAYHGTRPENSVGHYEPTDG
jgi:hypothetical protein